MLYLNITDKNINYFEYSNIAIDLNSLHSINKTGIYLLVALVKRALGRKFRHDISYENIIKLKNKYKFLEDNIKKLFIYANKYDIIKTTINGYCSKKELSKQFYSLIPIKMKNSFRLIFISLEILKVLERIYSLLPKQLLEEFNNITFIVHSSLKQIILKVRLDVRGIDESITKRHFEYAYEELALQLQKLNFNTQKILSYIPNSKMLL